MHRVSPVSPAHQVALQTAGEPLEHAGRASEREGEAERQLTQVRGQGTGPQSGDLRGRQVRGQGTGPQSGVSEGHRADSEAD